MDEENLFTIDIDVDEDQSKEETKPNYNVDYSLTQNDQIEISDPKETTQNISTENCWNCSKPGHSIRECTETINRNKINQNKKTFLKTQLSNKRYHDNKFSKFRAGHISNELRDALDLRDNELPRHIYMMRLLGYPPGWLAEAKITNSGIKMYNSRGKRIKDDTEEDGEILNKYMKYDIDKIIEFPGFNVKAKHFKDEYKVNGFPPMNPEHDLKNFNKYLEQISTNVDEMSDNSTDDEPVDMEMSEMSNAEIIEEVKSIDKRLLTINNENSNSVDSYEEGEIISDNVYEVRIERTISNKSNISQKEVSKSNEIAGSKELSGSNEVSKSNEIAESKGMIGSNEVSKSNEIAESKGTIGSIEVSKSNEIAGSKELSGPNEVSKSNEIAESKEVSGSNEVTKSNEIAGSKGTTGSIEVSKSNVIAKSKDVSTDNNSSLEDGEIIDNTSNNSIDVSKDNQVLNTDIDNLNTNDVLRTNSGNTNLTNPTQSRVRNSNDVSKDSNSVTNKLADNPPGSVKNNCDMTLNSLVDSNTDLLIMSGESKLSTELSGTSLASMGDSFGTTVDNSNTNSRKRTLTPDLEIKESDDDFKKFKNENDLSQNEIENEAELSISKNGKDVKFIQNEIEINPSHSEIESTNYDGSNSSIPRSQPINIPNSSNNLLYDQNNSPLGSITGSSFGTPNIKKHSSYSKLPCFENFNKDISDVIDFENLPDSVGKYKTMCNIITKIRNFMSSKNEKKDKQK